MTNSPKVSANAFDSGLTKAARVDAGCGPSGCRSPCEAGAVMMETVDVADTPEEGETTGGNTRLPFRDNGSTFGRSSTLADGFA